MADVDKSALHDHVKQLRDALVSRRVATAPLGQDVCSMLQTAANTLAQISAELPGDSKKEVETLGLEVDDILRRVPGALSLAAPQLEAAHKLKITQALETLDAAIDSVE